MHLAWATFVLSRKYSLNRRRRPSSCLLAVFVMLLAKSTVGLFLTRETSGMFGHFCTHQENNSASSPGFFLGGGGSLRSLALIRMSRRLLQRR